MRLYGAQRRRGGANPLGVGVIAVGSSYYIQDERCFRDRYSSPPICRDPWQVEGFTNGLLHAARRDPETRQWRDSYWSGRSGMAVVRSLRDGRRRTVAVRLLVLHDDLGLTKGVAGYHAARHAPVSLPTPHGSARVGTGSRCLTLPHTQQHCVP